MDNIKGLSNIFDVSSFNTTSEQFEELLLSDRFRLERIVSFGHPSPDSFWYEQEQDEWVMLIRGSAVIEYFDSTERVLNEGDYLILPHHVKHRVKSVSYDAIWLALHYGDNIDSL